MIAAIGDIHLGALDRTIPKAYLKVLSTIDRVIINAKEKGCKTIVLLGDIFDKPSADDEMVIAFWSLIRRHSTVQFHSLIGNHDMANVSEHSLVLTKWLGDENIINIKTYSKPTVMKLDGDRYLLCPHPHVIDAPSKVRYAFGHFGFSGAKGDNGFTIKTNHTPSGRWVLGDYHTPQRGKGYQYAGSICQVKFYEEPNKGYIEIDDKDRFVSWQPDILLGKATIRNYDDMQALDSKTYWQVRISAKAELPADWAKKHPNIVLNTADKLPSARAKVLMERVASEDPLASLDNFLRGKCGLSDKEIRLANTMIGR